MKILNISLEKKLFNKDSVPQKRVLEYRELFDRFDILVMSPKGFTRFDFEKMSIWPTNSFSRIFYMHDAYYLGKEMIKTYGSELISVQDPFEMGIVGWFLARKFKIKFQVQLHGDFFGSKYWRQESFLNRVRFHAGKFIIRRADGIRVVSQRVKESLLEMGVKEEKIAVVPIFSEIQSLKFKIQNDNLKLKDDKFVFLTVGRLVKVKNIGMQIEAMAEVVKKYRQAELWIVGEGPEREKLKVKIQKSKLENNVKLLGWQDNLGEFYSQTDVFLLTSNYEGWGMAAVEAASQGLPLIMTDVGCVGELIKNGESGTVIPVDDKDALAREMSGLINDDGLCRRLGAGAKKAIELLSSKEENLQAYKKSLEAIK